MTADYTGNVRAKKTGNTGITEPMLSRFHAKRGGDLMAVVRLKVTHIGEDVDGDGKQVEFVIDTLEPAPDLAAEHLRELTRSFHYERALEDGQADLFDDSIEPKVTDVLARGDAHKPHPFLPTDAAADNPTCEVCGLGAAAAPHKADEAAHPEDTQGDDADPGQPELTEPDGITDADTLIDDDLDGATDNVPDESLPAEPAPRKGRKA